MTALRIFAVGLVHLAARPAVDPDVQAELNARDKATRQLASARYGTREWQDAHIARAGAEARLARLLDVTPPPPVQLVLDDPWLNGLYAQLTA